jgi:indole-3-glycerol phosphate synthase
VRLIAELKRASPSRGLLAPHLNMLELAQIYAENGAAALSVLTDEKFFLGSLNTLRELRFTFHPAALLHSLRSGSASSGGQDVSRPLLRKDFILEPVQLYESRAAGADAILLIAAALTDTELIDLHALALELGLAPLVEVHTAEEIERVVRIPNLTLVGINNRDLKTFNVTLETTLRLRPLIPPGIRVVAESGIFTAADVARVAAVGVDAILVGEALVTAPDIAAKVRELSGSVEMRHDRPRGSQSLPQQRDLRASEASGEAERAKRDASLRND